LVFDYTQLRKLIKEKKIKCYELAEWLGITPVSLSNKLTNDSSFTQMEIVKLSAILEIQDLTKYFYTVKEQSNA